MKNTKNITNKIGVVSKINILKINSNKLNGKKNTKNSITPRQTNILKNGIKTNSNNKIKVNIISNNEENIDKNNYISHQNQNNRITNKSIDKIKKENGIKKTNSIKKVLTVNKSYHTIAKNKNKKNEKNNYNSLINSLFTSQNENKGYMTTTSTNNNINGDINSSKREKRSKSKTIQKRKTIDNLKVFSDDNNNNNKNNGGVKTTTTKKSIKKTKSNTNIKINLNNNFNNIINKNNNINNNKNEKNNADKSGNNLKIRKNSEKNLIQINKKTTINNIRNDSMDIKKKKRTSKSSKKLTIKSIQKKNNIIEDNANNKSTCTINNSKTKINMGKSSANELLYNSINNTKSIQILSPIKPKPKKNINNNKNSINLLGSFNTKKKNLLNLKNNNINNNTKNLKKKNSTIFQNKKPKINNQNKKNKKIINNNNNETNNTTGTIGTLLMNKEESNLSKVQEKKTIINKSFKNLKINTVSNITDSIESKSNINISNYINNNNNNNNSNNNNKTKIKNNKKLNSKNNLNMKIHIENNEEKENINDMDNMDNNEPLSKNTDNYYKLLDISPESPSSRSKKIYGMNKKNKSVSNIHIAKKEVKEENEENEEGLKKCPLSKKSLNRPKINDKIIIKFEELLEFETKLDNIINALSNKDNINEGGASNECAEFMSFYFHSSLYGIFTNFFNPKNKIIIHSGNNLLLLSIIITYHLSINPKMLTNLIDDMKYIFSLLKINYLLLIKKIEMYYDEEFPIKYVDILNQKLGQVKTTNCSNEIDIISKINKNCCNLSERMKLILNHYQRNNDKSYNEFNGIFKNISTVSEKNINNYFYNYLYINPFEYENNKINNINKINNNYNNIGNISSKNFSRMDSSISSISNTSIKGYDDNDNDSDNFYNDNMSYKTEKSSDFEREIKSVKSYKSSNYYGKLKSSNNIGSTINCDNNFYYNIENNIYENDEDGTNAYEIMQMLKDYEINKVDAPFLVTPSKKKYTLVLDLDETLIHLRQKKDIINIKNDVNIKINNTSDYFYDNYDKDKNKYLLQFRVGLFSFLTILKPFYEIISFTSATREYADVIINEIEKNRKFFDHKFYREHTVIYKDTFVKDISRIGRDIKKIIIIDNNERNFVLNKENGIKIAPYYGDEDNNNAVNNSINSENNGRLSYRGKKGNDNILLELKKILVMIYKDNYDDLREALKDYEDLIKTKVSMNL